MGGAWPGRMSSPQSVTFLLGELGRWRDAGLIDAATHERIARLYAPVPEDAFDAELEREASVHAEVERRAAEVLRRERDAARAARVKPERRRPRAVAALSASANDVATFRVDAARDPEPAAVALEREGLRALLYDSALWIAALLLVVFGSLYFLRLVWDDLDSVLLHGAIAGALTAYAALFFGVGYVLCRRRNAHVAGRTLFGFAMALLPLGSVAAGELTALLAPHPVLATVVVAGVLGVHGAMVAVMAGLYERAAIAPLAEASVGLALATTLAPLLMTCGAPAGAGLAAIALGFAIAARGLLAASGRVNLRISVVFGAASVIWALAVLVLRVAWALDVPATSYAPLVAALGAVLVVADHRLRLRAGGAPRLTAIGLSLHALVLLALAASVAGLARQGYFDLGARVAVLGSAAVATWTFARAARLHGRSALTWLAAGSGLFAYFFLPAPFIGAMQVAERVTAGALGYADQPLPVAYYGVVFAPYLALVLVLARSRVDLRRDAAHFALVIGGVATALAATSLDDLRPLLFTWPLYAAGALVVARLLGRRYPAHAAQLLLAVSALALGVHYRSAGVALAAVAVHVGAALVIAARTRDAPALAGASLAALLALVVGVVWFPAWAPACAALALVAAARLARGAALSALATIATATAAAASAASLLGGGVSPVLAGVACVALALTALDRAAPKARAVRGASLAIAIAGFAASVAHAAPGQALASWWGFAACAGAVAYAAVAVALYRRERPDRAAWITALLALAAVAGVAFLIEADVPARLEQRAWLHVAALALAALGWWRLALLGRDGVLARTARGIAVTLATLSAMAPISAVVALGFGLGAGDPRAALVAALLALAALGAARDSRQGWQLSMLVVIALPVLACAGVGVRAISAPLAAVALLLGIYAARGGTVLRRAPQLAWPVGVAVAAMLASRARLDRPELLLAVATLALVLAAFRRRKAASIATLAAVQLGVLFVAILTSTGRYPPDSVLAILGAAMLASAALLARANVRRAAIVVAVGEAALAVVLTAPSAPRFVVGLALATLVGAIGLLVRERRAWTLHAAAVVLPITWAILRWQLVKGPGAALDAGVVLLASHAAFWIGTRTRRSLAARPLEASARLYPVLLIPLVGQLGPAGATVSLALAAIHYAAMAQVAADKHLRLPAALCANAALATAFIGVHVGDPLAYGVPVALTLLFLVHTYADELGPAGRGSLRTLVLLAIYGLAVGTALVRVDVTRSLVLVPLLCVAGMLAGSVLRVRVYLTMGMAFLAGDLVLNLVRYGLESRPLGALFLTALGLALVAAMVAFSLERERILRRYSMILGELRSWD